MEFKEEKEPTEEEDMGFGKVFEEPEENVFLSED